MKTRIKSPKVFISYAWGTSEYQKKVIDFATSLRLDGVDVVLDKWCLKEGNDTYAFMEECVTNPEITSVIILLDKNYSIKADQRKGGVGTETQIISPEVYNKTSQERFLPVVFELGDNGEVCKPAYLKGILHFDLSKDETYETEYKRLVRALYGVEILRKPDLGNEPNWLEHDDIPKFGRLDLSKINRVNDLNEKNETIWAELEKINTNLLTYKIEGSIRDDNHCLEIYQDLKAFRDNYLFFIKSLIFHQGIEIILAKSLETVACSIDDKDALYKIKGIVLHETFIYFIALLFKYRRYESIGSVLKRTYFAKEYGKSIPTNFNVFYSFHDFFDGVICRRDKKEYFCGTANYWIDNIAIDYCSRNDFIMADIILYNYALYGTNYHYDWYWFPITYIYFDEFSNPFIDYSTKLISKEKMNELTQLLALENLENTIARFVYVSEHLADSKKPRHGYNRAFHNAPIINDYIKIDELGKFE